MDNIENENKNLEMSAVITRLTEDFQSELNISHALDQKITDNLVSDKIDKLIGSIKYGILQINSKFSQKTKGYGLIKDKVLSILSSYETSLNDMAKIFDSKIEKLNLDLAELYGKLIGEMANSQDLDNRVLHNQSSVENSTMKERLVDRIKNAITSLGRAKQEGNPQNLLKAKDEQDIAEDLNQKQDQMLNGNLNDSSSDRDASLKRMKEISKEIENTKKHIAMIRDKKQHALQNAMESQEKGISKEIRKPRIISRFTRFIASKINLLSMIDKNVLSQISLRIAEFRQNDLNDIALALSDKEGEAVLKEEQQDSFSRRIYKKINNGMSKFLNAIESVKAKAKEEDKKQNDLKEKEKDEKNTLNVDNVGLEI